MKKNEIREGGTYVAKVNGKLTTVRVDSITETETHRVQTTLGTRRTYPSRTLYGVTNLVTGKRTTFRSATKFRRETSVVLRQTGGAS